MRAVSIRIEYIEHAHVRVIHRNIVPLFECDPVQLCGSIENTILQHIVQFEIRLDLIFIEIELRLSHLLRVEIPIPASSANPPFWESINA